MAWKSSPSAPTVGTARPMPNADHQSGHRGRLKEKFLARGATALADYELLELLLSYAIPRRDVKPLAKELVAHFGSLSNVLAAPTDKLTARPGVGEHVAALLKLTGAMAVQYRKEAATGKDTFHNKLDLIDYLYTKLSGLTREEFHVVYLDSKNQLLADDVLFTGTLNASAVYPREVIKAALDKGAAGLVLAHNHPSGNPTPSPEDEILTIELAAIASPLGITVHDHIIIGDGQHYSFKDSGKI